jgi:hypothetical protein
MRRAAFAILAALCAGAASAQDRAAWNGFDLAGSGLGAPQLQHGGQPRDGIPALDAPRFVPGAQAGLGFEARVLGVEYGGEARAYPLQILAWHEVVNDRYGAVPVTVAYSPLAGSALAMAGGRGTGPTFGVSGLLLWGGTLMYDRSDDSLWSLVDGTAVNGTRRGQHLAEIPVVETTWADWFEHHPGTLVLTQETGHERPYQFDPYADYRANSDLPDGLGTADGRYHPKEPVLVLTGAEGTQRAYPFAELARLDAPLRTRLDGADYEVQFSYPDQRAQVRDGDGTPVAGRVVYWFAWHAAHPEVEVYVAASP